MNGSLESEAGPTASAVVLDPPAAAGLGVELCVQQPDDLGELEEAEKMAAEALLLHVEGMLAEGETIPEPSSPEQVKANPEYRDGKPIWVPLLTDAWLSRPR